MSLFKKLSGSFEDAKKYSNFVGFIIRAVFCFGIGSFFYSLAEKSESLLATISHIVVGTTFLGLGCVFFPLIENSIDSFVDRYARRYKSPVAMRWVKRVVGVISAIVFFAIAITILQLGFEASKRWLN